MVQSVIEYFGDYNIKKTHDVKLFSDIVSDVDLISSNGVSSIPLAGSMLDYPDVIGVSVGTDGSQYVVSGDHFDTKTLVYDNKDSIFAVDMRDALIWLPCNEGNFDSDFDSMFSSDAATINIVDGDSQLAKLLIDGSIPISSDRAYICNDNPDYEYMSDYDRCVHALEFMFPYQDHGEDIVSYFDMENDGELIEHNDGLEFAF